MFNFRGIIHVSIHKIPGYLYKNNIQVTPRTSSDGRSSNTNKNTYVRTISSVLLTDRVMGSPVTLGFRIRTSDNHFPKLTYVGFIWN